MAVTVHPVTAGSSGPLGSFAMSLVNGWNQIPPEQGGRLPVAGDVVILEVRRPAGPVIGPSGWTAGDSGRVFWKMIGPHEPDPVFLAEEAGEWEICGYAVASTEIRPFDDSGSAVPWSAG